MELFHVFLIVAPLHVLLRPETQESFLVLVPLTRPSPSTSPVDSAEDGSASRLRPPLTALRPPTAAQLACLPAGSFPRESSLAAAAGQNLLK